MNTYLGIEFGSTRIKGCLIDDCYKPHCFGDYTWKSSLENGIWTYDLSEALVGLRTVLSQISERDTVMAVGISGMMHGYLAFDKDWNLLVPFRTWQNTITKEAADKLTELFEFNIPERWSIAHLYQAILNKEEHVGKVAHVTTLAGYIHYLLTGVNAVGIGEASGIFPIDSKTRDYNEKMLDKFNSLSLGIELRSVLPKVLLAGEGAGSLTESGARLIENLIPVGTPFVAPEGDAGTGMVATEAISERTGNISAGTSVFSMVVLEKPLSDVYREIDVVSTPDGKDVAMVHCNNCTSDTNAWFSLIKESVSAFTNEPSASDLFEGLYKKSLEGESDCGGVLVCNYLAGESISGVSLGVPMVIRSPKLSFTLANFIRASLYSSIATLKIGMEILEKEGVKIDSLVGHGGYFKTEGVGQKYMASALNTPVSCMDTAAEGGAYGMAILASYLFKSEISLSSFLKNEVFKDARRKTVNPDSETREGFLRYITEFKKLLKIEKIASECLGEDV